MPAFWMILASLLFACMGVCVKLGADRVGIAELTFYRGLAGLLFMAVFMRSRGTPFRTRHWRLQLTRAVAGSIALGCYFFAISLLPLAAAVTLNYTSPIFVALLLALWFREPLRALAIGAVALGFLGVVVLLHPTIAPEQWLGAVAGLASGLIASLAYINVRELGRAGEPESRTVFYFSCVTCLGALPFVFASDGFTAPDATGAALVLGIGVFGTAAQLAMTRAYRVGATIVAANLAYSTVIFASLFGVVLWGEVLPAAAWLGIGMIVVSGMLITRARAPAPAASHRD
ncbi:DMT family transporter [Denitromonas ohlonensis]|uniref:EamA family transporter n=2 Tax=Denitromonas TaxID=139331 RepID=A0A557S6B5_9RHOO|nr:EamA family transporter [Denitromonas ohlonensis]TVO59845.1 EamA family transporter [Denitromonas ohlonensis]TVO72956.1 EamA family transporter [Denitromonas ohlonensis]